MHGVRTTLERYSYQFDEVTATISRLLVEDGCIGLKDTEFVEVSEHLTSLVWQPNSFHNWMLDYGTLNMHEAMSSELS